MTKNEIENAAILTVDADTAHEDAREWYSSYGWHYTTEEAGDIELQIVEYDWLDDASDDSVADKLIADDSFPRKGCRFEAEAIVEMARTVREAAESICGLLDEAVEAYERGDLEACRSALLAAYSQESDHGDAPATQSLASELLAERDGETVG